MVPAAKQVVWDALNDPDVLAACIDGCQSMEKVDEQTFKSSVKAKIGPVSATFKADLQLMDIQAPDSYTIEADVKGGPAGFGKGVAKVQLADGSHAEETRLTYTVSANVGGKLAQIGSRLIDGAARKMADDFFGAFEQKFAAQSATPTQPSDEPQGSPPGEANTSPAAPEQTDNANQQWKIWAIVFAALLLAAVLTL